MDCQKTDSKSRPNPTLTNPIRYPRIPKYINLITLESTEARGLVVDPNPQDSNSGNSRFCFENPNPGDPKNPSQDHL